MNIEQITQGLLAKFSEHRIVFWYDPEQSFIDELVAIENQLSDICVVKVQDISIFELKKRLELDEPKQSFLLYFPCAEPEASVDWLLDIRLYSTQFYADYSSILLNELGIKSMGLRAHIQLRESFFANKQRFAALKKWITESETEESLDRKMMAALVKADSASLQDILMKLFQEHVEVVSEDAPAKWLESFEKFGLLARFWSLLRDAFNYCADAPNFADFVLKLFSTEFWTQLGECDKSWLENHVLPSRSGQAAAMGLMSGWRDSREHSASFNRISAFLADALSVSERIKSLNVQTLAECQGFEVIEQQLIRLLVTEVIEGRANISVAEFETMIAKRLVSHWVLAKEEYRLIYQALRSADALFALRKQFVDGFYYDSCAQMYEAYQQELYQFDQEYRLFNENVHTVISGGGDILRELDEAVENLYSNWYLFTLGQEWDRLMDAEKRLDDWKLPKVPNQYQFYKNTVAKTLKESQAKRVFVVISDAMRYEVAEELVAQMNQGRFKAELSSQLGVVPSYTQLGMASLLPHQTLDYAKDGIVLVDGQPSNGLENRHKILQGVKGMGVSAHEVLSWSNQEGRDKVRDAEVVYIYHDSIDAIGDKRPTEDKTFEACRTAIEELKRLVGRIINRLNGSRMFVTSDHGFLFQQQAMQATDKASLTHQPESSLEAKKRYIVGENLGAYEVCLAGDLQATANFSRPFEFLLPKGAQRFNFIGGAKFVHGGAMLQEICVPIVEVRELDKVQAASNVKRPVGVIPYSQPIKLHNSIDKVRFIQTEAVGEETKARSLDIYIVDDQGQCVSSVETVIFDSVQASMDERTRAVQIKLLGTGFERNRTYYLMLVNSDDKIEQGKYVATIDLAFQDDFGF